MYTLHERFEAFGADGQPAGIEVERSSNFPHLHSRITGDGYALSCLGNRHMLTTPALHNFTLELQWYCTLTSIMPADVGILFRYDPVNRVGVEVGFAFDDRGNLSIQLFAVDGLDITAIGGAAVIEGVLWEDNVRYPVSLKVEGELLTGRINGHAFSLTGVPDERAGQVGFQRRNFIGEWVLCDALISSEDTMEEEVILPQVEVVIPQTDGGTIPYELYYSVINRGGRCYLDYTFLGGPQYRHKYYPPLEKSKQYSGEINTFKDAYVRVYFEEHAPKTAMLKNGLLTVSDPNLQWKTALDKFLDASMLPLTGSIPLPEGARVTMVTLGYDAFSATGHQSQKHGVREYFFDCAGKYLDADLCSERYELLSPADKAAVQIIPKNCYDYPTVKKHFEENHYFSEEEEIDLTLKISGVKDMQYLRVEAQLQDAYADKMEDLAVTACDGSYTVKRPSLPVGVYRVEYRVYLGERLLRTINHAFEVFDITGKRCAPMESGLPFIYSTPNELRYLDRDSFDPWNPMPSCDVEHYFPCSCMTGVYGEKKRIWEILPLFGRKWYVWMTDRTMNEHEIENHPDIVRHADYLITQFRGRLYNMRTDYWKAEVYQGHLKELLDQFLKENPGYAGQLDYQPDGEAITRPQLKQLLEVCGHPWYEYANDEIMERVREVNEKVKALNPDSLRAYYGPFCIYTTCYASYYCIKKYGYPIDESLSDELFTGFAQFEDYPASCAYHTYRAPWAVMTIRLHIPKLRIYPEQYSTLLAGCVDGAVKFAAPPMGVSIIPEYFQMTQSREFVWNTPGFTKDGFVYWDDYGFMKRDFNWEEIDFYARSWKSINEHRPLKPLRGAAFITDYCPADDRFTDDIYPGHPWLNAYNISEENQGYFYERLRESGVPGGFGLKWDALEALTAAETDCLVLPSMANAPEGALEKIRALHAAGVSLLAVSDVTGLEDLFGVRPAHKMQRVCTIFAGKQKENIFPYESEFRYEPDGAQVCVHADGVPVLMKYRNAALFNTSVSTVGRDTFTHKVEYTRENISAVLRSEVNRMWKELTDPVVTADSAGLTHFMDVHGNEMLFVVDYAPYDLKDPYECRNECMIRFSKPCRDVVSAAEVPVNCIRNSDGMVVAAEVILRARESALLQVIH